MTPHASRPTASGIFVTGTDTGVGKTLVACALLHAFARAGRSVVGMKPVAAGAVRDAQGLINDDVAQLSAASNAACERALVNPYCFEAAIAPHIAAAQTGVTIELERIVLAYRSLSASAELVVVEGAGGFCVPLNDHETSADLTQLLALPVVLVVGVRLGCLNHALLTAQAIRERGLKLAGWVANRIDAAMPVADQNIAALSERLGAPRIATLPFSNAPDARQAATRLDLTAFG